MRAIRSMFVLALVVGVTALLTVACGDKSTPSSPSAVSTVGGAPATGGAVSLAAKADKVDVCHATGNGSYNLINVNGNALPAHLAHGDGQEGDAFPGMPGYEFGATCEAELVAANCSEIRAANPDAGDGDYTLFVGQAFDVYCHDMAGTPTEYLTLVNVGPNTNFSQASAGGSGGGVPGVDDVRTNYTKVRLDPATLIVDTSDQTFSTSTSTLQQFNGSTVLTSMPYGTAYDCILGSSKTGIANVDLTGTPFSVASTFVLHGSVSAGSVNKTSADQVVNLTGGGNCGWMAGVDGGPFNQSGGSMQLAFLP